MNSIKNSLSVTQSKHLHLLYMWLSL